jgi:hypothetical protein
MDGVVALLEDILHARAAKGWPTVITTLSSREDIAKSYSAAIARWLFDAHRIELDPKYDYLEALELA